MIGSGGWALALALLAGILVAGIALAVQVGQRRSLVRWLENPDRGDLPDGVGAWREVFSGLQRLRKDAQWRHLALSARLERFREAAQALPDGVVLLDGGGHIDWLNAAAGSHFGLDVRRDAGTLVEQLIRHSEFHDFLDAFRSGRTSRPLILDVASDGTKRTLSLMLAAYADAGTLLLSRDVTDIARTEAMRRDFIANVSHELRTPLTVVSGFLEALMSETPPEGGDAKRFLALMKEQSDRMVRLVEDLLTLSRLENDTAPPREEAIDVPALLDSLRAEAMALSGGRHTVAIEEASAGNLRGSADEIRSAFGNLVSNAVRYTPTGGTVRLCWRSESGSPVFRVVDSGIGIPAEHIARLTERFYRVDKGRSSASGGTGLGLAIVKHVLVRHQGTLHITSTPNQGSEFAVTLPSERLLSSLFQ